MDNGTITIDAELFKQYTAYAQEAGITVEKAVNQALDKWMDETGRFVFIKLVKRHKARRAGPVAA